MIIEAILKINPNAKVIVTGDNTDIDTNVIEWKDGTTPISKTDIEAQFPAVEVDKALDNIRIKRNRLLAETDYLALSDQTLSSDMSTYRQNLRDITNGVDTVEKANNVTWPTKP
tara:strand:- start:25 stop:366 length:342 start_codon:yes stop_codon:yes gene_type:complete